jgi:hypothetical protein
MKRVLLGLAAAAVLLAPSTPAMARGYYYGPGPYYRPYYRPYFYGAYRPYYPPPAYVYPPPVYGPAPYPVYPAPGVGVGVYTPGFSFGIGGR